MGNIYSQPPLSSYLAPYPRITRISRKTLNIDIKKPSVSSLPQSNLQNDDNSRKEDSELHFPTELL